MEHDNSSPCEPSITMTTTSRNIEHLEDHHASENESDGPVFHDDDDDTVGEETKDSEMDEVVQNVQQQLQIQDKEEEKNLHRHYQNKNVDEEPDVTSRPVHPQVSTAGTRPLPQSHSNTSHLGSAAEYSFTYTEASARPRRVYKRPNPQRYHTCNPALLYSRLSTMKAEAEVRRSHSRGNTPLVNADDDSEDDLDLDELDEATLLRRLSTEKARKASREAQKYLSGGATMTHADVLMMFRMMQNDFPIPSPTIHGVNNSVTKKS